MKQAPQGWHFHENGGGLVQDTATVEKTAWVSGNAQVFGNARVSGDAWVFGDARVSGNAWVFGNARVSGDARVSGNALVSGDAWVSGNALVSGDAWMSGNAWVKSPTYIQGTRFSLTYCAHEKIAIGCMVYSFDEWTTTRAQEIGEKEGFTQTEIESYKLHIEHIIKLARLNWPERYGQR